MHTHTERNKDERKKKESNRLMFVQRNELVGLSYGQLYKMTLEIDHDPYSHNASTHFHHLLNHRNQII